MMICGRFINRVDPRLLLVVGFLLTAAVLWEMTGFTPDVSQWTLVRTGVMQGMGPRLHVRAALDHHLRDADAGVPHARDGALQPAPQYRLEHRHLPSN